MSTTIRIVLTATFSKEDGSEIDAHEMETDVIDSMKRFVDNGMLTIGHDDVLVAEYGIAVLVNGGTNE